MLILYADKSNLHQMRPLVSLIVPVYNASKYLGRCLDSVVRQTYANWECVLVDDGSEDDSGRICDAYALQDGRFKVVHQENRGVSSARNAGICASTGECLFFCDADDEVLPDGIETLVGTMGEAGCDVVFGGYEECDEHGVVTASPRAVVRKALSREDAVLQLYHATNSNYEGYLWCKLFKAGIIKDNALRFDEDICFNEDRLFVMNCLSVVTGGIVYNSKPVYRYIHHQESAYWSLQKQWNPKYVTDLTAYVRMYGTVCRITADRHIRLVAKEGIRSSVKTIRRMLKRSHTEDTHAEQEVARMEKEYLGWQDKLRLYLMRRRRKLKALLHLS